MALRMRLPLAKQNWKPHFNEKETELAFDIYNCTVTSCESERTLRADVGETCGKCGKNMVVCIVDHVFQSRDGKSSNKTGEDLWKLFLARLYLNIKWALVIEPEPVPPSGSAFQFMMLNPFFALGPCDKGELNDQFSITPEDLEALKGLIYLSPEAIDYPKEAEKLRRTARTSKAMYQQYRRIFQGTIQEFPAPDLSYRVSLKQNNSEAQKNLPDSAALAQAQQVGEQSDSTRTSAEASVSGHTGAEASSSSQTSPERNLSVEKSDVAKPSGEQSDEEMPSGKQFDKPPLSEENFDMRDPSLWSGKRGSSSKERDKEYRAENASSRSSIDTT